MPPEASAPNTLPALLAWRAGVSPHESAVWSLDATGQWRALDWRTYFDLVSRAAAGLRRLGLRSGERLGIMAPTCVEWDVAQLGALTVGAVVVGVDPHEHDERLAGIFQLCNLSALIVADEAMLARIPADARARLRFVVTLKGASTPEAVAWQNVMDAPPDSEPMDVLEPDAPALIVFTSGTTGAAKGIVYTHRQVSLACASIVEAFAGIGIGARLACWLPLSNLFQRMINFCAILRGAQTYYVSDPREIMQHLPRIAPHVFVAVPRFYEKFYAGIRDRMFSRPSWQRRLFDLALAVGRRVVMREQASEPTPITLAWQNRLLSSVRRPVRLALGGELRVLLSGSAPMPKWLLEDMAALGLPVYEAYGMSENIIPISINRPGAVRFGTVGQALRGNEIRIADDGELLVRGPGVFAGYLGEGPAARTADGFHASGDYAEIDADGFIRLTGRKSEIFKTSTGRRVAPAGAEDVIKQMPYAEQCMLLGANRPFAVAILWPDRERLARALGQPVSEALSVEALARILSDVNAAVASLPDYQQPAGLIISWRLPSLTEGEITLNLKLRRSRIEQNYAADIERLYAQIQTRQQDKLVVAKS